MSFLDTDAYKFSMMQAGWPQREEVFYLTTRKGCWFVPIDIKAYIKNLIKTMILNKPQEAYLAAQGFHPGSNAIPGDKPPEVLIRAQPPGSWTYPGVPIATVKGPSWLVSALEPQVLQLQWLLQVATHIKLRHEGPIKIIHDHELELVDKVLDSMGPKADVTTTRMANVGMSYRSRYRRLLAIVSDDTSRIFEVGMRGASSNATHYLLVDALQDLAQSHGGQLLTSNVHAAYRTGAKPVGTMGHEHIMRHSKHYGNDLSGFMAMRESLAGPVSYLVDTYDTFQGVQTAMEMFHRHRTWGTDSIRFDSGDIKTQALYTLLKTHQQYGGKPVKLIFEGGWNLQKTQEFETLRRELNHPPCFWLYGYGSYLVDAPTSQFSRNNTGAAYKLCQTGDRPAKKFSDTPAKESLPGDPRVFWKQDEDTFEIMIYQPQELPHYYQGWKNVLCSYRGDPLPLLSPEDTKVEMSPGTQKLIKQLGPTN